MKKIALLFICIVLTGCLGTKKIVEKQATKTTTEKVEVRKDSTNVVEKNKAIADKLDVAVPNAKTSDTHFNKKVDQKVDEILAKLNTTKTSGDNSYKLYYNLLKRQVEFEAKIGETQNENTSTNSEEKTENTNEEILDTYIYKRITTVPWFLWIAFYFIFFDGKIASLLSNFIPQLRGATSILSLFKKKNDN
tara:strand:+ start:3082 stop:3657 length:576 start_codon:yes stop_codon:yes gene_type:complete